MITLTVAGYGWLILHLSGRFKAEVCLFKMATGIPCPSCGTTRGILQLLKGHISAGWWENPLSLPTALLVAITPWWLLADGLFKRQSFYHAFRLAETYLRQKIVAFIFILLITGNWLWNIFK